MKIILAKSAGFCFGVDRAVKCVYDNINQKSDRIFTYGPIIHNDQVMNDLKQKGVIQIDGLSGFVEQPKGKVIIRSHGITQEEHLSLEEMSYQIVDATCPYVKRIHKIVKRASEAGDAIVIIGDPTHPEVIGIKGWSKTPVIVVPTAIDASKIELDKSVKWTLVVQTTFNEKKFDEIIAIFSQKGYDINIVNTICAATRERQEEALAIAKEATTMIVIGSKHSSNTQKLFNLCMSQCENTIHIETIKDLDVENISGDTIGITAGASTPSNIIEEVLDYVRQFT